jgi:hypothetical protein
MTPWSSQIAVRFKLSIDLSTAKWNMALGWPGLAGQQKEGAHGHRPDVSAIALGGTGSCRSHTTPSLLTFFFFFFFLSEKPLHFNMRSSQFLWLLMTHLAQNPAGQ